MKILMERGCCVGIDEFKNLEATIVTIVALIFIENDDLYCGTGSRRYGPISDKDLQMVASCNIDIEQLKMLLAIWEDDPFALSRHITSLCTDNERGVLKI